MWIVALAALGVGVSAFFVFSVVPPVIERAYHGESIGPLNWMIEGQSEHPVEFYLSQWNAVARGFLALEAVVGLLLALASWPPLQRLVDARVGPVPAGSDARARWGMGRGRVLLAGAVILLLAGAQLIDVALQAEHWPFSRYGMYAGPQTDRISWIRVEGVTSEGEVPLDAGAYFHPFEGVRLAHAFAGVVTSGADANERTEQAMKNLVELYETNRRSGTHAGLALKALRLYRMVWRIDPALSNLDQPEQRTLLYEAALR